MTTDPFSRPDWRGGEGGRAWRKNSYREMRREALALLRYYRRQRASQDYIDNVRRAMADTRAMLARDEIPLAWPSGLQLGASRRG